MIFIVERYISEYTHHNIVVGVFESQIQAEEAKTTYISHCKINDKWEMQGYRDVINLEEDVIITNVSELSTYY